VTRNLLVALAVLTAFTLGFLAWPRIVQAEENVSFGIKPAKAHDGNSNPPSYFSHTLAPGTLMIDEALIMNRGDVPLTLQLYAADAITAVNGGTGFANDGEEKNGVARWLSVSVAELSLQPGEERMVPFTIKVPPDASPGQHTAGLVLEAVTTGGASTVGSDARFTVNIVRRAGVAVLIDVPGTHLAGLEITGICLRQQDSNVGATFQVAVRNTGNVYVRGQGSLVISDREGMKLASIPVEMDAVLAGDATHFQVTHPVLLPDGSYLLSAALDYAEGTRTVLAGAEVKVKHGQPEVGCSPPKAEPQEPPVALGATLLPTEGGDGPPIGRYAIYAACSAALIAAAAAAILVRRTRARRSRERVQRDSAVSEEARIKPKHGQPRAGYRPTGRYNVYAASLAALVVAAPAVLLVRRFGTRRPHRR